MPWWEKRELGQLEASLAAYSKTVDFTSAPCAHSLPYSSLALHPTRGARPTDRSLIKSMCNTHSLGSTVLLSQTSRWICLGESQWCMCRSVGSTWYSVRRNPVWFLYFSLDSHCYPQFFTFWPFFSIIFTALWPFLWLQRKAFEPKQVPAHPPIMAKGQAIPL